MKEKIIFLFSTRKFIKKFYIEEWIKKNIISEGDKISRLEHENLAKFYYHHLDLKMLFLC
jgi:hypothetical protein